jgi:hypothetical protein
VFGGWEGGGLIIGGAMRAYQDVAVTFSVKSTVTVSPGFQAASDTRTAPDQLP